MARSVLARGPRESRQHSGPRCDAYIGDSAIRLQRNCSDSCACGALASLWWTPCCSFGARRAREWFAPQAPGRRQWHERSWSSMAPSSAMSARCG
eukprot:10645234-Lingulodinium_polyedra.AAC.1